MSTTLTEDRFGNKLQLGDFILYTYSGYPELRIVAGFTKEQALGYQCYNTYEHGKRGVAIDMDDSTLFVRCGYRYAMKVTYDTAVLTNQGADLLIEKFNKFKSSLSDQILDKVPSRSKKPTKRIDI